MAPSRKQQVIDLLKSLETKDPVPLAPTGIYDLFRIEKGRLAEHWDTLEAIPPRDQWKNSNGKF
jgi:predicted SnoaL-like aldol condensation-catalyzing enzyme